MRKFRVAFARPYESGETLHIKDGGSTLKIIIVDQFGLDSTGDEGLVLFPGITGS